jgi:membrane protein YdbS with pleckstrin-like domain
MEDAGQLKVVTTKRTWWRMLPAVLFSTIVFTVLAWFVVQVPRLRGDLRIAGAILALPVLYIAVELLRHISIVYGIGHSEVRARGGIIDPWEHQTIYTQIQTIDDDPIILIGSLLRFTELAIFMGHEEPIKMPRCPRAFADELNLRWQTGGIGPGSTGAPPTVQPPKPPTARRRGLSGGRRRGYG